MGLICKKDNQLHHAYPAGKKLLSVQTGEAIVAMSAFPPQFSSDVLLKHSKHPQPLAFLGAATIIVVVISSKITHGAVRATSAQQKKCTTWENIVCAIKTYSVSDEQPRTTIRLKIEIIGLLDFDSCRLEGFTTRQFHRFYVGKIRTI
jgi:hypothetical protein